MDKTVLKVGGMSCQGCVKNVTGVLQGLDGVVKAEVSLEKGEARVDYDAAKVSKETLVGAVEDAGFDAA